MVNKKKHIQEFDPNETTFGNPDYRKLCEFMNWFHDENVRKKMKNIKVIIEIELK